MVKNEVAKKTVHDESLKEVNAIQTIDTSDLVKKGDYNTKIEEIEGKISDQDKYNFIPEFNKLT